MQFEFHTTHLSSFLAPALVSEQGLLSQGSRMSLRTQGPAGDLAKFPAVH